MGDQEQIIKLDCTLSICNDIKGMNFLDFQKSSCKAISLPPGLDIEQPHTDHSWGKVSFYVIVEPNDKTRKCPL